MVNPPVAGIKGNEKRASDNTPVSGATITALHAGETVDENLTDDAGNFNSRIAAGTYQGTVSAPGFVSQTVEAIVGSGNLINTCFLFGCCLQPSTKQDSFMNRKFIENKRFDFSLRRLFF